MQTSNADAGEPTVSNPRDSIKQTYLRVIENSFQEDRPQIKLVNFGTGSGKTHQLFQAVCETIRKYPDHQIIGLYVAPLREHLKIPFEVKRDNPGINFYVLYSQEWRIGEDFLKKYKQFIPIIQKNKKLWDTLRKENTQDKVLEARQNLENVLKAINRYEFLQRADFGDSKLVSSETIKAQRDINGLMEKFLETLIKSQPDEDQWTDECRWLVEVFFPLHFLREKSGFLMLTYDKFETRIPYFDYNGVKWVRKNDYLDQYISKYSNGFRKFILAFDEQEDGYQIMLDKKIDIVSPQDLAINNALSSINREFSILFSTKHEENRQFLRFIRKNPGAFYEFDEYFEKGKEIDEKLVKFAEIYWRLTSEEGNSTHFLQQVAAISEGIDDSLKEIAGIFGEFDEEERVTLTYEMVSKVFTIFENNRSLLIPQKLYSKLSSDLMNIFSYNNLYIYNIEPLKKLYLSKSSGGHVHIIEQNNQDNVSVAELIYAILAIRLQIEVIKKFLTNVLDAEDSQSQSLEIWFDQINKLQKASEENIFQNRPIKYLNRDYVYQSLKSIINIMEISRYQHPENNLINRPYREVSIGSTVILTSPEHKINSMLENNSNVIFLISATGGIFGDLSTSYDLRYLEDQLRNEAGKSSFQRMNEVELRLSEEIRHFRMANRQVSVSFFEGTLSSFPNQKTQEVAERFEALALKDFVELRNSEGNWFGIYKIQELQNFIRFLFYLFEDDTIQDMIAFTQTLTWTKELIRFAQMKHYAQFVFEESPEHPNIYYVHIKHKSYFSTIRVKLILYEASFNANYKSQTQKTYLDELSEEENQKIFFISAYQSASKGLNPIIKTRDGKEKDFDSLALLMDRYYTVMGPTFRKSKDGGKSVTLSHFALMKSIVRLGDTILEIKDFNSYLNQPEAAEFQELQHQILLGKGILQSIGRTERRDFENQVVKIFLNSETRKNLVNFYRYLDQKEPDEIRKLSVNNYQVFLKVREEEVKQAIQDYDSHIYQEIDATVAFQKFREQMLDEIEQFHQDRTKSTIIEKWELLRDPLVFQNPAEYLQKLRASGLFPDDFIDSLFFVHEQQPAFVPYLATENDEGKDFFIISDSVHGKKIYHYQKRLYPDYLKVAARGRDLEGDEIALLNPSTDSIQKLYRKLLPQPAVFDTFIPRPSFFHDVLFPSFTEHFTDDWIREVIFRGDDWKTIKSKYRFEPMTDFKQRNTLYEMFDLYYIRGKTLLCIDVKAWSRASDNRLSQGTLEKAQRKLDNIHSNYPEFQTVKGLLLNLHAPHEKSQQHSSTLYSGNLIYFDSNHFPVEADILKNFMFAKEGKNA